MTRLEQEEKVMSILKEHGIEMNISGCGCCGSPTVYFAYKGEPIIKDEDDFNIEMVNSEKKEILVKEFNIVEFKKNFPLEI